MSTTVDDVLNECIERLAAGETVEQCLASYPDYAVELEPMLRTSASTMNVAADDHAPRGGQAAKPLPVHGGGG